MMLSNELSMEMNFIVTCVSAVLAGVVLAIPIYRLFDRDIKDDEENEEDA